MKAPTHVLTGVAAYCILAQSMSDPLPITAATLAAASLGSLAPDIDDNRSWIGRRLFFFAIPLRFLLGHRGLTHSLIAAALATVGLYWAMQHQEFSWAIAFLTGYLVHLAGDWNTNGGVPLAWPSERKFKAPWAFNTGGPVEAVLFFSLSLALLYLGWNGAQEFLGGIKL